MTMKKNPSLELPIKWADYWTSAVGQDVTFDPGSGNATECARLVVVGKPAGALVLNTMHGPTTWTVDQINALGGQLWGQWTGIVASGSAAYQLKVGW